MEKRQKITICLGSSCFSKGSKDLLDIIKNYLKENNLNDKVFFNGQLCMDKCKDGPNIIIGDKTFGNVNENNIFEILDNNLKL